MQSIWRTLVRYLIPVNDEGQAGPLFFFFSLPLGLILVYYQSRAMCLAKELCFFFLWVTCWGRQAVSVSRKRGNERTGSVHVRLRDRT